MWKEELQCLIVESWNSRDDRTNSVIDLYCGLLICAHFRVIASALQKLGAIAVIVGNNVHGPAVKMYADADDTLQDTIEAASHGNCPPWPQTDNAPDRSHV